MLGPYIKAASTNKRPDSYILKLFRAIWQIRDNCWDNIKFGDISREVT